VVQKGETVRIRLTMPSAAFLVKQQNKAKKKGRQDGPPISEELSRAKAIASANHSSRAQRAAKLEDELESLKEKASRETLRSAGVFVAVPLEARAETRLTKPAGHLTAAQLEKRLKLLKDKASRETDKNLRLTTVQEWLRVQEELILARDAEKSLLHKLHKGGELIHQETKPSCSKRSPVDGNRAKMHSALLIDFSWVDRPKTMSPPMSSGNPLHGMVSKSARSDRKGQRRKEITVADIVVSDRGFGSFLDDADKHYNRSCRHCHRSECSASPTAVCPADSKSPGKTRKTDSMDAVRGDEAEADPEPNRRHRHHHHPRFSPHRLRPPSPSACARHSAQDPGVGDGLSHDEHDDDVPSLVVLSKERASAVARHVSRARGHGAVCKPAARSPDEGSLALPSSTPRDQRKARACPASGQCKSVSKPMAGGNAKRLRAPPGGAQSSYVCALLCRLSFAAAG
jgi:hypothetical protein